jgi:uracil-DNA glycosylase
VNASLRDLNNSIIGCKSCPRLVKFREDIASVKRRQFRDFQYWGKPITGYGDHNARLVILGLAPAAHGANRTGRVFTGDSSARFLVRHLHKFGFANQATSETRYDGLEYSDCYVTAVVRCVPPHDRPTREEIDNCSYFLEEELGLLSRTKVILTLGKVAFDSYIHFAKKRYGINGKFAFEHGKKYLLSNDIPIVFASYHPSPRNTNTGKMTSSMFSAVLRRIKRMLDQSAFH